MHVRKRVEVIHRDVTPSGFVNSLRQNKKQKEQLRKRLRVSELPKQPIEPLNVREKPQLNSALNSIFIISLNK